MRSEGTAHQIWKRREFCIKQCWYMTCQMLFRRAPSAGRDTSFQKEEGERAYKGNILIPSHQSPVANHFFPFFIFFFECDLDFADALVFFSRFSGE